MAELIKPNGDVEEVLPWNGVSFTLEEIHDYIGGAMEPFPWDDGRILLLNEDGKRLKLPVNATMTQLFNARFYKGAIVDFIVGNALILTRKEMGEDE